MGYPIVTHTQGNTRVGRLQDLDSDASDSEEASQVWKDSLQGAFDHVTRLTLAVRAMATDLLKDGEDSIKSMCEKAITISKDFADAIFKSFCFGPFGAGAVRVS